MTKPPELLPCPFCGEDDPEVLLIEHMAGTIIHPAFRVVCDNCGASTGYTDRGDHIAAWNTRTPDPAVLALVEALRPFADIFVGQNPDWQPLVRLDRDAIIAVRAALAAFDNTKEDK